MSATAYSLVGFISWALILLIVMEVIRTYLVVSGRVPANGFAPDNGGLSPFMQRLARAHANCIEGLPIFGGLLGVAIMTSRTAVTDPLAYVLLGARIVQSDNPSCFDQPNCSEPSVHGICHSDGNWRVLGVASALVSATIVAKGRQAFGIAARA